MEAFSVGQLQQMTAPGDDNSDGSSGANSGRRMCVGGQVSQIDASNYEEEAGAVDADGRPSVSSSSTSSTRGGWCGDGWGQPVTTSGDGKWLRLELSVHDGADVSRLRFDLTYRFVFAADLQPPSLQSHHGHHDMYSPFYGDPAPGTVCSRNLHSCDQQNCVIQSPNFPGLYPR